MTKRKLFYFILVVAVILIATGIQIKSNPGPTELVAGRNVNMVTNDPYLQRQNEPSLAVSTLNPRHLLAGANDYSLVDFCGDDVDVTYDAWLGVFKSFDGGESWEHDLLPPYQGVLTGGSPDQNHPLYGFEAAADPTIRAGKDGWFFFSGIAFDRAENGDSVVFVARYKDTGNDIVYHDTKIIDIGTSGQFSDKPWSAVDVPRPGYPQGIVYIVHSVFMAHIDPEFNIHSKILVSKSIDGGNTWKNPVKVSEGERKNQGTIVAIDPNDGTVYVAWRRFVSGNEPHGILIAKSEDFGNHFTQAVEIATPLRPFDQDTIKGGQFEPAQFRTLGFPALAVDQYGAIHVAWSQRDVDLNFVDDARIVLASQAKGAWGSGWTYVPVESPVTIYDPDNLGFIPIHSHQFMPSLTCGAGKLMISWYDSRYSLRVFDENGNMRLPYPHCPFGESTIDPADRIIDYWPGTDPYSCEYRETIDVRAAQATPIPNESPDIGESIQVSRYIWVLEETGDPENPYIPIQGQFNPPNYKLFSAGTAPFHGDYLDIVSAPQLVLDDNVWRFSQEGDPLEYYVTWTDNRDVLPPNYDLWNIYTPPVPGSCDGAEAGMRNQNVYVSKLALGIEVGVLGEFIHGNPTEAFVIYIKNKTGSPFEPPPETYKTFQLNINVSPGEASFFPNEPPPDTNNGRTIVVDVPDHSSISRIVFNTSASYPIEVQITEIDTGDFADSVVLEWGEFPTMTGESSITKYELDYINWFDPPYNPTEELPPNPYILTPNIMTPNIMTPNIMTPNIMTPNIMTPNIMTPNIMTPNIMTPNIMTPNIMTPNIMTMSILNPNIMTQNILSTPPGPETEVVDKIWTVTNNTNAISSYTFKSIAGDSLPEGLVYLHLLIFKVHITPSTDGCAMKDQAQHELLVNIAPPEVIFTVDPEDIEELIGNPYVEEFENATFSLGPGEEGLVILRVIDTHQGNPQGGGSSSLSMTAQGESTESTEAENFAGNLGGLAVTHTSTEGVPVNAITLMILPTSLPPGQAGKSYYVTLNAIGGAGSYSWAFDSAYPAGLTINPSTGEISGIPREAWDSPITVIVTDADFDTDTQGFSLSIADPEELTVTMNPNPSLDATKAAYYSGLTFTATGGVPFSSGGQLYNWTLINAPPGLSLQLRSLRQTCGTF